MKLVKEHINEKFVEDSDPIKDMGIGKLINLYEKAKELTGSDDLYLYRWVDYYTSLNGKTISGYFIKGLNFDNFRESNFNIDVHRHKKFYKIKIKDASSHYLHDRFIFVTDKNDVSYYVCRDEKYAIT